MVRESSLSYPLVENKEMDMRLRLICLSFLLTTLMAGSSGCLVVAAGAGAAGTVAYLRGDMEVEESYDVRTVYVATRKAMDDLNLHVIEGETGQDALVATVVARDATDKRIAIKLKSVTDKVTKISIRIGTFGDEAKSQMIYNRIRENLQAAASTPTPASSAPAARPSSPAP
jgi:isopentenyl phosphate kinase